MVGTRPLFLLMLYVGLLSGPSAAHAEPAAPAVSTFAPVGELESVVRAMASDAAARSEDEAAYRSGKQQLARDANTLIVLAVALAMHDAESALKAQAGAVVAAAEKLAASDTQPEAQAAVAALEAALADKAPAAAAPPSTWEHSASQDELMKQVAFLQGKIKRGARGARLASTADENARWATVLAVIAQAVEFDTVGIEGDEKLAAWRGLCGSMRDAAAGVHAALTAKDAAAVSTALERLEQSCTACHRVFRPDLP